MHNRSRMYHFVDKNGTIIGNVRMFTLTIKLRSHDESIKLIEYFVFVKLQITFLSTKCTNKLLLVTSYNYE